MKKNKNINWKEIFRNGLIFLILFISFFYALQVYNPGCLTFDSYNQLIQIHSNVFTYGHPILHTLLEYILLQIYDSPFIIALFQILFFSIMWTGICHYMRRRINNSKFYRVQIILTLIIALNPLNAISSITLWKDILYSYLILLFTYYLHHILDKQKDSQNKDIIKASIVLGIIPCIRFNGYIILAFFIVALSILIYKYCHSIKKIFLSIGIVAVILIFNSILSNFLIKNKGEIQYSVVDLKIFQMIGSYQENNVFTKKEKEYLEKYIFLQTIEENFNPYYMDPLGKTVTTDKYQQEKISILTFLAQKSLTDLESFFDFFGNSNVITWRIVLPKDTVGTILTTGYDAENNIERITQKNIGKQNFIDYSDYLVRLQENPVTKALFFSPALYLYLSIIVTALICYITKRKTFFLLVIPNLLNVLGIALTTPVQDLRYVYPNFLIFYYLLLALFFYRASGYKKKAISSSVIKKVNLKNPKILLIVPAYNEENNIKKVFDNINSYNKKNHTNYDMIVINDGSCDNTKQILEENQIPHINLVHNLGIGGAVQTGYKYAFENDYDIAIQFDGDNQHDVQYVKNLIQPLIKGEADLVIGSRFLEKNSSQFKSTRIRRIGINIISFLIKVCTDHTLTDTTSGFRAANKNIIREFANRYPSDSPEPSSFVMIAKKGYQTKEVAVSMKEREGGVSSITSHFWKPIYYMINVTLSVMITSLESKGEK